MPSFSGMAPAKERLLGFECRFRPAAFHHTSFVLSKRLYPGVENKT